MDRLALLAAPLPGDDVAAMFKMSDPPARWMAPPLVAPSPAPRTGISDRSRSHIARALGRDPTSHLLRVSSRFQIHPTRVRESVRVVGSWRSEPGGNSVGASVRLAHSGPTEILGKVLTQSPKKTSAFQSFTRCPLWPGRWAPLPVQGTLSGRTRLSRGWEQIQAASEGAHGAAAPDSAGGQPSTVAPARNARSQRDVAAPLTTPAPPHPRHPPSHPASAPASPPARAASRGRTRRTGAARGRTR